MIKVELKDNLITIKGHAGYADKGKDIVCASVSSIVITTINAIVEINPEAIDYSDLDNKPQINNVALSGNKTTEDLIPIGTGLTFDEDGKLCLNYRTVPNAAGGLTAIIGG